jgi:hypothetical protein
MWAFVSFGRVRDGRVGSRGTNVCAPRGIASHGQFVGTRVDEDLQCTVTRARIREDKIQ